MAKGESAGAKGDTGSLADAYGEWASSMSAAGVGGMDGRNAPSSESKASGGKSAGGGAPSAPASSSVGRGGSSTADVGKGNTSVGAKAGGEGPSGMPSIGAPSVGRSATMGGPSITSDGRPGIMSAAGMSVMSSARQAEDRSMASLWDYGREVTRVTDAGPRWTQVGLRDGTVETRTGDRASRNNNPGNLEYTPTTQRLGAVGHDDRGARERPFAVFSSRQDGLRAQSDLLGLPMYANKTIQQAIELYAPRHENNTDAYASRIASAAGVPVTARLSELTDDQRSSLIQAMHAVEGNTGYRTTTVQEGRNLGTPPDARHPSISPTAPNAAMPARGGFPVDLPNQMPAPGSRPPDLPETMAAPASRPGFGQFTTGFGPSPRSLEGPGGLFLDAPPAQQPNMTVPPTGFSGGQTPRGQEQAAAASTPAEAFPGRSRGFGGPLSNQDLADADAARGFVRPENRPAASVEQQPDRRTEVDPEREARRDRNADRIDKALPWVAGPIAGKINEARREAGKTTMGGWLVDLFGDRGGGAPIIVENSGEGTSAAGGTPVAPPPAYQPGAWLYGIFDEPKRPTPREKWSR